MLTSSAADRTHTNTLHHTIDLPSTMSDTEMNTPADAGAVSKDFADMPQGDIDFIMTCIQNAIDGALTVSHPTPSPDLITSLHLRTSLDGF